LDQEAEHGWRDHACHPESRVHHAGRRFRVLACKMSHLFSGYAIFMAYVWPKKQSGCWHAIQILQLDVISDEINLFPCGNVLDCFGDSEIEVLANLVYGAACLQPMRLEAKCFADLKSTGGIMRSGDTKRQAASDR
jgi:hypothetical protein